MKTSILVISIGVVAIMSVAGVLYLRTNSPVAVDDAQAGGGILGEEVEADVVIRRVAGGYEPNIVTIQQGDTVSFVNDSEEFHWPASDLHPTHGIYAAFDSREPIPPGEIWSFTFERVGEWTFHDHLRANYIGLITVEPVH